MVSALIDEAHSCGVDPPAPPPFVRPSDDTVDSWKEIAADARSLRVLVDPILSDR